jgi:hypothetical protein
LTTRGKSVTQPLVVVMDPRVKTPAAGLAQQFALSKEMYDGIGRTWVALEQLQSLRTQIRSIQARAGNSSLSNDLAELDAKAAAVGGEAAGGEFGPQPRAEADTLNSVSSSARSLMGLLQGADVAPTTQAVASVEEIRRTLDIVMRRWNAVEAEVGRINVRLKAEKLPEIKKILGKVAPAADEEDD